MFLFIVSSSWVFVAITICISLIRRFRFCVRWLSNFFIFEKFPPTTAKAAALVVAPEVRFDIKSGFTKSSSITRSLCLSSASRTAIRVLSLVFSSRMALLWSFYFSTFSYKISRSWLTILGRSLVASKSIAVIFLPGNTEVVPEPVGVITPFIGGHLVREVVLPDHPAVMGLC